MKSFMSRLLLSCALVGLLSVAMSHAQAQSTSKVVIPTGIEKVASVEGITEYKLKNGLRVLLFPDQSKPTVTVNITYLVGSRHEGYGETGMAHLLEHLVFKGTPKHPNIPQELTEHGARPNGSTWYDRTNYFETFSATDENLHWALDLEADRMINSYIAKKDLDSEMTVVRNEFESGENDPGGVLFERVLSTAFLWHNYGKSTIGSRADLENVPIERLQAFYKKYYQPDNAVLLVAGKIDESKTLKLVDELYSGIPAPDRKLYTTYTREPVQDGERLAELRRVGDVQVASCAYHIPAGSHPDFAAIDVLTELLTSEPAGRLYKALVETKKASSQYGYSMGLKEPGFVYFSADVLKEKPLEDASKTMLQTIDDLKTNAPTKEEVSRAKTKLLKDLELAFNNSDRVGLQMSEFIAQGDWRLAFLYRDALEKVTPEDVARVAKAYFKPSNRTIGRFVPEANPDRVEITEAPEITKLVKDYKGKEKIAEGEAFDPSPSNIEGRTERGKFPNGMEYALLTKKTRGNSVVANLTLRIGDAASLKNKATIARFTASMLNKGSKTKSRQAIQDELDKLKARMSVFGGGNSVSVSLETERENLPALLALVGEVLKTPTFPAEEFEKLKQEELAAIEQQRSEPGSIAIIALNRILNPYPKEDVRYVATFDEQVQAIKDVKLEDIKQFYKDFYGASSGTMAVVGDFDAAAIKKAGLQELGDWKNPKAFKRIPSVYTEAKPANEKINTPDKANANFYAGMNIKMRNDNPDYPAMVMANYMLGGGFLNSRLATRIRQKEGLSYGVGSSFSASPLDESGGFFSYAIFAPENGDRLEQAFREEIEKAVNEGFTKEEVDAAKSGFLQSQQVNRSQDRSLSGTLNNYLYIDRDFKWDADFEKKIAALTPEVINQTIKKYIDINKMVMVRAGDFEKAKKTAKP